MQLYVSLGSNLGDRLGYLRQAVDGLRPFVLIPLADIAPDFTHPVHNLTIGELLAEVDTNGVTRIPESLTGTPVLQVAL